jgi:hypothetical protein
VLANFASAALDNSMFDLLSQVGEPKEASTAKAGIANAGLAKAAIAKAGVD